MSDFNSDFRAAADINVGYLTDSSVGSVIYAFVLKHLQLQTQLIEFLRNYFCIGDQEDLSSVLFE